MAGLILALCLIESRVHAAPPVVLLLRPITAAIVKSIETARQSAPRINAQALHGAGITTSGQKPASCTYGITLCVLNARSQAGCRRHKWLTISNLTGWIWGCSGIWITGRLSVSVAMTGRRAGANDRQATALVLQGIQGGMQIYRAFGFRTVRPSQFYSRAIPTI